MSRFLKNLTIPGNLKPECQSWGDKSYTTSLRDALLVLIKRQIPNILDVALTHAREHPQGGLWCPWLVQDGHQLWHHFTSWDSLMSNVAKFDSVLAVPYKQTTFPHVHSWPHD